MSKEKELIKNTAIISFGKICTQLISFFLLPLYTTVLSTEEYGIVDLVITYSSLLLPFVTLALEQGVFRFLIDVRSNIDRCSIYISTTVVVSSFLLTFLSFIVLFLQSITQNSLYFYFMLVMIATTISAVFLQFARGLGDNITYSIGSSVTALGQVIFNIVFLLFFKLGAEGMMLATFVSNILCGVIIYVRCDLSKYILIRRVDLNVLRELMKYSLPLIPNQLSWWALNASNRIIVQFFIGVAGNGLIAVSNKFSGVYIQFSNIFNISWTESVALHINDSDAEEYISKIINSVYRLFMGICCLIIVFMPFLFPLIINVKFNEAYGLIPIFMTASLFNVVVSLYGVIYVAHKKTVEIAKTAIYAAGLNIFTHLALVQFIGIYASAISTLVGYGGMALYRYFHSRKYIVIKFDNFTLLASVFMLAISYYSFYCSNLYAQLVVLITIVIFTYYLNKEIILFILKAMKKKIGVVK